MHLGLSWTVAGNPTFKKGGIARHPRQVASIARHQHCTKCERAVSQQPLQLPIPSSPPFSVPPPAFNPYASHVQQVNVMSGVKSQRSPTQPRHLQCAHTATVSGLHACGTCISCRMSAHTPDLVLQHVPTWPLAKTTAPCSSGDSLDAKGQDSGCTHAAI